MQQRITLQAAGLEQIRGADTEQEREHHAANGDGRGRASVAEELLEIGLQAGGEQEDHSRNLRDGVQFQRYWYGAPVVRRLEERPQARDVDLAQGKRADDDPYDQLSEDRGSLQEALAYLAPHLGRRQDNGKLEHKVSYLLNYVVFHSLPGPVANGGCAKREL